MQTCALLSMDIHANGNVTTLVGQRATESGQGLGGFALGLRNHPQNCSQYLNTVCSSKVCGHYSHMTRAHNHFHLHVLEAAFTKVQNQALCHQREVVKMLYFV